MRRLVAIAILIFEVYLIITLSRSVWDLWEKQAELEIVKEKVDKLARENKRLQGEYGYVQTDEFVEKQAREKLKLVKPNETVVVIPESVLRAATASATPTPVPPNWVQWMRLFL